MTLDAAWLWAVFSVFVRASAMMLSSPVFGAQTTPVTVRVLTTLSVSFALTATVKPQIGPMPEDLISLAVSVANEAGAGLIIGTMVSLVFYAIQMAGSLIDFQVGLGSSQVINPATGVPVTIISQIKFLLAVVIFLAMNGHHLMFRSFVESYSAFPAFSEASLLALQDRIVPLLGSLSLLAIQIAAPVAAVGAIVDAGLGIVNKAVPQIPVFMVGVPAKILVGLMALAVTLPSLVGAVDSGLRMSMESLHQYWTDARSIDRG